MAARACGAVGEQLLGLGGGGGGGVGDGLGHVGGGLLGGGAHGGLLCPEWPGWLIRGAPGERAGLTANNMPGHGALHDIKISTLAASFLCAAT
jgi:hypothetical protein